MLFCTTTFIYINAYALWLHLPSIFFKVVVITHKWLFYFRNMPEEKKILMKLHPPWHLHPCLRITEVAGAVEVEVGTIQHHPLLLQHLAKAMTIGDGMHPLHHLQQHLHLIIAHPDIPMPQLTILGEIMRMTIITIRQVQAMIRSILSINLLLLRKLLRSNISNIPQPQTLTR